MANQIKAKKQKTKQKQMQFTGSNKTKSGTPRVTPKTWMLWCMFLTFLPQTELAWLTQLHHMALDQSKQSSSKSRVISVQC